MNHPHEQELVSYLTGDDAGGEIERHLDECPDCSKRADGLRAVLDLTRMQPVPEPDEGFEERIWARQRAELLVRGAIEGSGSAGDRGRLMAFRRPVVRRMAVAAAMAAAVALAFVLGLYTPPPGADLPSGSMAREQRAVLVALGAHLERTRTVLLEVSNASVAEVGTLTRQAERARELIGDNRLYRQTAANVGLPEYALVLADVERVLLELARGGAGPIGPEQLGWLRARIRGRDLLFRTRVLQVDARSRQTASPALAGSGPLV